MRYAINGAARYGISGMVAQRCGQTFPDDALAVNVTGSLITGLFVAMGDSEGQRLVSPSLGQFFMIGVCGGSVTLEKARVIRYRAKVEGNG